MGTFPGTSLQTAQLKVEDQPTDPHEIECPLIIMTMQNIFPNTNHWRYTSLHLNNLTEAHLTGFTSTQWIKGIQKNLKIVPMLTNSISRSSCSPSSRYYRWLKPSYWILRSRWLPRLSWVQGKHHEDSCRCPGNMLNSGPPICIRPSWDTLTRYPHLW